MRRGLYITKPAENGLLTIQYSNPGKCSTTGRSKRARMDTESVNAWDSQVFLYHLFELNNIYAPFGNISIEIKSQVNECSGIRTTTSDDEDEDDDGDGEVNSTTTWILVAVFIVVIISILSKPKSTSTGAGVVIKTG